MKRMFTSHLFSHILIQLFVSGGKTSLVIDEILEAIGDGKWYDVKEIAEKTGLHEFKVKLITSFLDEYDFVQRDPTRNKVKLTPRLLSFLNKIQDLEREEAIKAQHSFWILSGQ